MVPRMNTLHDMPGPTSRVLFSQRLRLHYVDWGNPEAPPLLLVHGLEDDIVPVILKKPDHHGALAVTLHVGY